MQINVTEQASPKNVATLDSETLNLVGNTYSKSEIITKIDEKTSAAVLGFHQSITPTTPAPTGGWKVGIYIASVSGTYTNQGGLVIDISLGLPLLILSENNVWSKVVIPIQNNSDTINVPFSNVVTFVNQRSITAVSLTSDITFAYNPNNAKPNSFHTFEIRPNGRSITFSNSFSVQIQPDIDYDKPLQIVFQKPVSASLKPSAVMINLSELDASVVARKYRVNPAGGSVINTWFEYFEFPNNEILANHCIFNVGLTGGLILANFTVIGGGGTSRWGYIAFNQSLWQPNTVFTSSLGGSIDGDVGIKFKTGSVKPTSLIVGNTANFTFEEVF